MPQLDGAAEPPAALDAKGCHPLPHLLEIARVLLHVCHSGKIHRAVALKPLRKEYAMCKDIYDRSDDVEKTVERIEFPRLVEQERQKSALKKNGREER